MRFSYDVLWLICLARNAPSSRNPAIYIVPIPYSGPPESCVDDSTFLDAAALGCSAWAGYNCSLYWTGYTAEELQDIQLHCPAACSLCTPPARAEFRTQLQEYIGDWTWCSDNPKFVDIKGYSCADWSGYSIQDIGADYDDNAKKMLAGHCGKALGLRDCDVCQDNSELWPDLCIEWLGYACISDVLYYEPKSRIEQFEKMVMIAGNCAYACGLCDRVDNPSDEDLMLSCTNDAYLEAQSVGEHAARVIPFCESNDNGWCNGEYVCDGNFLHEYINKRMPQVCHRCIPPEERLNCPPGTYRNVNDVRNLYCGGCWPGRFNPFANASECGRAPEGYFVSGANETTALPCNPGTYSDELEAEECKLCPTGNSTFGLKGQTSCPACPPGSIAKTNGSARCDLCERGRFLSFEGGSLCDACEGLHRITKELGAYSPDFCICEEGYYETQDQQPDCVPCLEGMVCPLGSSMVNYWAALRGNGSASAPYPLLKEKYFAFPDSPLDVFECMTKESCPGMTLAGISPCCVGCQGLNCGLCNEGQFHSRGVCEPCMESGWQIPIALGITPFAIGLFHHLFSYRASKREVLKSAILGSVTVGAAVFFAQVMGLYYRLLIDWPYEVSELFEGSSLVLFNLEVLRASCTFTDSLATRFGLQLAAPIFVGICFFFWMPVSRVLSLLTGGRFPAYTVPSILNGLGMLFQAMYISLVAISISVFECYESPNGKGTLRLYTFVECGAADHNEVVPLGIAAMVIYVAGFMTLCVVCNYIAPRYFSNPRFALSVRFLIFKFRPSTWWYGIVLMIRSALIGMVAVMEPDDGSIQFYLMLTFLVLAMVVHLEIAPYTQRCANRTELVELTLLIIMLIFGSWFIPKRNNESRDTALTVAIFVCVGLVLSMVVCVLCYSVLSSIFRERILQSERKAVRQSLPAIQAALSTLLAMSTDQVEDFLLRGNYVDHWHLVQASRFILVDECGIQGKSLSTQRISPTISQGDSEKSLQEQHHKATLKIVDKTLAENPSASIMPLGNAAVGSYSIGGCGHPNVETPQKEMTEISIQTDLLLPKSLIFL